MESPKRKFAEIECLGSETAEERQRKRFARAEREKQVIIVIDDDVTASLENEIESKDLEIDKLRAQNALFNGQIGRLRIRDRGQKPRYSIHWRVRR